MAQRIKPPSRLSGTGARRIAPPRRVGLSLATVPYSGPSATLAELAARNPKDTPLGFLKALGTPFEATLDYISNPVHAVGNVIEGDWENAGKNFINLALPGTQFASPLAGDKTLPSEALRKRGMLPDNFWLSLATDIALDPLTYVTLGTSGAARGAARAGEQLLSQKAMRSYVDTVVSAAPAGQKQAARRAAWDALEGTSAKGPVADSYGINSQRVGELLDRNIAESFVSGTRKDAARKAQDYFRKNGTLDGLLGENIVTSMGGKSSGSINTLGLRVPVTAKAAARGIARLTGADVGWKPLADMVTDVRLPMGNGGIRSISTSVNLPRAGKVVDALPDSIGKPLRALGEKASPRLTQEQLASLNFADPSLREGPLSYTRDKLGSYGGFDKGVTDAVVMAGHYSDRGSHAAARASAEMAKAIGAKIKGRENEAPNPYGLEPLTDTQTALKNAGVTRLNSKATTDAVFRSISLEVELPQIAARLMRDNPEVAAMGMDAVYDYAQQILRQRTGYKFVPRQTLLQHFGDDVERMRDALNHVNRTELDAGVVRGIVENYLPHRVAVKGGGTSRSELRQARKAKGTNPVIATRHSAAVQERTFNDILEFVEAGYLPEMSAPELLRLRRAESFRILAAHNAMKAIASQSGVRMDMTGKLAVAEERIALLRSSLAEAWTRWEKIAKRKTEPGERAQAWADVQQAQRDLKAAEALRVTDDPEQFAAFLNQAAMNADGPVDEFRAMAELAQDWATRLKPIKEADARVEAARAMRESDDPEVRAAADELAQVRDIMDQRTDTVEKLIQQAGMENRLKELEALEGRTYAAYLEATGKQLNIGKRADRVNAAREVTRLADRADGLQRKISEILENDYLRTFETDFADDAKRLLKVNESLNKVNARLSRILNISPEAEAAEWKQAAEEVAYQQRRVEQAQKTLQQVEGDALKRITRAEQRVGREEVKAARRKGRAEQRAEQSARRARSEAIMANERASARSQLVAAKRFHRAVRDASQQWAGTPQQFRAVGRKVERLQRQIATAENRAAKMEMQLRRSLSLPATKTVSPEQFRTLLTDERWERLSDRVHSEFIAVPPDIRAAADRAFGMVFGELGKSPGKTLAFLYRATSAWKKLALATPGYFVRNSLSDLLMMYVGGFRDVTTLGQAAKAIRNGSTGQIAGAPKGLTYERLRLELDAQGIRQSGFAGGEVTESLRNPNRPFLLPSKPGEGLLAEGFRSANEARENWVRAAMYLEGRKNGLGVTEAAERTHKWLFDYSFVAPAIGTARKMFMPFIVYPYKAIPALAEAMVRTPGYFANYAILRENAMEYATDENGNPIDWNLLPTDVSASIPLPDFMKEFARVTGLGDGVNPSLFNPSNVLPTGSINSMLSSKGIGESVDPDTTFADRVGGTLLGAASTIASNMNPLVGAAFKAPALLPDGTGYDLRGFRYGNKPKAPWLAEMANAVGIPVPGYHMKASEYAPSGQVPAWHPLADILAGLVPLVSQTSGYAGALGAWSGASESARNEAVRKIVGLNIAPYDMQVRLKQINDFGR